MCPEARTVGWVFVGAQGQPLRQLEIRRKNSNIPKDRESYFDLLS